MRDLREAVARAIHNSTWMDDFDLTRELQRELSEMAADAALTVARLAIREEVLDEMSQQPTPDATEQADTDRRIVASIEALIGQYGKVQIVHPRDGDWLVFLGVAHLHRTTPVPRFRGPTLVRALEQVAPEHVARIDAAGEG